MHVRYEKSSALYAEARRYLPGGVNSPVRAMRAVGREPVFMDRGDGPRLWDVDGNEYLDYVGSWGPMILGHLHPAVVGALEAAFAKGTSFGTPSALEVEMARRLVEAVPSVDMVRMTNSGTEATMSALRVARGHTGRDLILKFVGCYHGHGDSLLVSAGSGVATFGLPDSPGVTQGTARDTLTVEFNDLAAAEEVFSRVGEQIAAVIVEPVAGNMGVVPPAPGFLEGLRAVTSRYGAVLIFDEVMTGFRVAYSGAQERYGVTPDMTTLGKVIGGGLPVGAFGGRADIMEKVSPAGSIYQAGTLSGNPLAMAAGIATLDVLKSGDAYQVLEARGLQLEVGLIAAAATAGVSARVQRVGAMLTVFFTERAVVDFPSAKTSDTGRFGVFFRGMLDRGIYLAPSQFEAAFLSTAHTEEDIARTVGAASEVLGQFA
ncbi:MAG TPA: glutamate-1-semialdehyde 2,1-aminomutase [Thermoleophilia bacterium]|nr:glutamate-1-semialdehyde 2,1-aminomutase [Thermoleophilia bacterium]